jgi:N-acetyl-anhydromuramyl-L-alanine amidase AmpD
MPIERKPSALVPKNRLIKDASPYQVKDGDSWSSIASRFGIPIEKLIYANFETLIPAEINWYLHHYVGCNRPTHDGNNWMFSSSAKPGKILIPPIVYTLPEVVIVGQAPPRFYTVATRPEDWSPPADAADGGVHARTVVTRTPWSRKNRSVGSIRIKTRSEWGASDPIWANEVIYYNTAYSLKKTYTNIVIHHTDNSDSIKSNERREQGKGFAAIGYHFFIEKTGDILEGRPLEVMGSHAGTGLTSGPLNDPDWGAVGIVLQGDYHHSDDLSVMFSETPPEAQLASLKALIAALRSELPGITTLLMHKEVTRGGKATVCPGDGLYQPISTMRENLGLGGGGR